MRDDKLADQRVNYGELEDLIRRAGTAVGLPESQAALLASLLTLNDLRGIFSHGTSLMLGYARLLASGTLNSQPAIETVRETPLSLMIDGDGGLGYFPVHEGTKAAIEKALESGVAVLATRNHGHFGAAGIYARMTAEHDLLAFVTSGHQLGLRSGMPLFAAGGGSPMAFSVPVADSPPLVVDFGCMHDLYANDQHREQIASLAPGVVFRSIGLGEICQTWGGFLTGLTLDLDDGVGPDAAAEVEGPGGNVVGAGGNQGSLIFCFRIDLFADPSKFKVEVRKYVDRIRSLSPITGYSASYAAGLVEAATEVEYRRSGIPITSQHLGLLRELAADLGIDPL